MKSLLFTLGGLICGWALCIQVQSYVVYSVKSRIMTCFAEKMTHSKCIKDNLPTKFERVLLWWPKHGD